MKKIVLTTDTNTIEKTSVGTIIGVIYFMFNGRCFPEKGWFDFPIRLVGWWLNELLNVVLGAQNNCQFMFMDGPFSIKLELADKELMNAYFVKRGLKDVILYDAQINVNSLLRTLVDNGISLIEKIKQMDWQNEDCDYLAQEISRAKKALKPD